MNSVRYSKSTWRLFSGGILQLPCFWNPENKKKIRDVTNFPFFFLWGGGGGGHGTIVGSHQELWDDDESGSISSYEANRPSRSETTKAGEASHRSSAVTSGSKSSAMR